MSGKKLPQPTAQSQHHSEVLSRLQEVQRRRNGWTAQCPAHDDERPSLSIALRADGRLLLHCFAGCRPEAVVAALGLEVRDLFPPRGGPPPARVFRHRQPVSLLAAARAEVLHEARRQQARLAPYRDLNVISDFIRRRFRFADKAREIAAVLGPGEHVWNLLAHAARLETEALAVEAEVDAVLTEGRIA